MAIPLDAACYEQTMKFEDSPCARCPRQAAMAEALRHANIDLSVLLATIADDDMQAQVRNTLAMIDALSLSDDR